MMQRAVETCCLCGSEQGTACVCGLRFCSKCLVPLRVPVRKPGQCSCAVIATALQRGIYRPGDKAAVLKRQTLLLNCNRLGQAGRFLVLAELMGVEAVTDTLLGFMMEVIAAQLREILRPAITAEQIGFVHGRHSNITGYLIERVAKAHADQCREHVSYCPVFPPNTPNPTMRPSPLIGYLSGTLDNADLLRGVLTDAKEETWLILGRKEYEQRRVRRSDDLLDNFSERKRLLIREGTPQQQAESIIELNIDILVLTAFPDGEIEHILSSNPARHTLNWRAMSGSLTDLCQYTITGDSGHDADSRTIQVGFDQPVRLTSLPSSSGKSADNRPDKAKVGLPTAGFVVMFPGFLVQVDRFSLWTWMQLVAGLDASFLVLTAETVGMVAPVNRWVKEFADCHSPFAISRVLLLAWEGHDVHCARIGHSSLCVATLNPMQSSYFSAAVLAEGIGLLVLSGTGSADVRASGLGALLIAKNADDFVQKGHAWASQSRNANSFLCNQREQGVGYFARDRVSTALHKQYRELHAGETPARLDEAVEAPPVYEDDVTARFTRIKNEIGEERLNKVMFYKPYFERILHYLEGEGIKFLGLAGIGGSAYVLRGVLTRDIASGNRSGKFVAVKIARQFQRLSTVHNSSVLRDGAHGNTMADRMRGSRFWSQLVPKPLYVLFDGRSFIGFTEPTEANHVIVFSVFDYVAHRFEDSLVPLARGWRENGVATNDLVLLCQELFLGIWHAHRNGLFIGDIKPENIGQTQDGKVVFWDTGHGRCGAPKEGDGFGKKSTPLGLMRRNSTCHFSKDGSNPRGDANLYRAKGQGRVSRKLPFMFLTKQDMQLGNERSQHGGRGLGRLGNGTYTYYDCKAAEERAEAAREDPDAACDDEDDAADDVFQGHRVVLQLFNQVDWTHPDKWERQATAAAASGDPRTMLEFLKSGTLGTPLQPLMLQRFAEFLALGLGPRGLRPRLIDQMTHLALTMPIYPPEDEQDILNGRGVAFPGGTAGHVYAAIKQDWRELQIPSTRVLLEPVGKDKEGCMGAGLQAVNSMKDKDFAGFYCGTMRGASTGVMDTFPSRFGVSVRSVQDKFSIDGFMGTTLTLQWLKDHQATGVFMNAGDWQGGPKSNVFMDRNRAWTDPATGIVWIPMYCTCDIPAGDFLRWRYRPVDGEGGVYTFNTEVQSVI